MTAPLHIDGLRLAYEGALGLHTIVDGFSLALAQGQVGCLLGPSGCGKTSVLRAIAGLLKIANGKISLDSYIWLDTGSGIHGDGRGHLL